MHWITNFISRNQAIKKIKKILIIYWKYDIYSGTEEFFNLMGRVDIINSTLGKALGGAAGGYTTGSRELIELLKQRSRPYLFSNTLPPAVVGSASKVIDILMESSEFPRLVQINTERFRSKMVAAGFTVSGSNHAICPVMLGEARLASVFADEMLSKFVFLHSFTVFRTSISIAIWTNKKWDRNVKSKVGSFKIIYLFLFFTCFFFNIF